MTTRAAVSFYLKKGDIKLFLGLLMWHGYHRRKSRWFRLYAVNRKKEETVFHFIFSYLERVFFNGDSKHSPPLGDFPDSKKLMRVETP